MWLSNFANNNCSVYDFFLQGGEEGVPEKEKRNVGIYIKYKREAR